MTNDGPRVFEASELAVPGAASDPVLEHLNRAEVEYRATRELLETQTTTIAEMCAQVATLRESSEQLSRERDTLVAEREQQRARAERHRQRAEQLALALKDIHRALFAGNVYHLILQTCLTITGATRGMYLTASDHGQRLRVRAAIDVDGYPQTPPSTFITALCNKVIEEQDSFVCDRDADRTHLPGPTSEAEQFTNCVVTPVVLMKNFDGIVIVADKLNGDFDEDDIETLLSVGDQAGIAIENIKLQRDLQRVYLATVSMLADAVEAKDSYTQGHCEMVSRYARLTANLLNLPEHEQSLVCYAALLHDVGKIGVSDGILNKAGQLLPEERELVRSHVRIGHDLIAHVEALKVVANAVLHHHEWYDGTGYPHELSGETIPIASRIVCVVDSYCAMITRRSYKDAFTQDQACAELMRCSGTQFDPMVVDAFLKMLDQPEAHDLDADDDADCGLLPGFGHIQTLRPLSA